jgi:hypothetical protein
MKTRIATFKGYSADACYYINGDATGYDYYNTPDNPAGDRCKENADAVIEAMRADYGPSAYIVDCGQETFFATPDYGSQLKGDCKEYSIIYNPIETIAEKREYSFLHSDGEQVAGSYWKMKGDVTFKTREKLLPWQERGLMYTASGYGIKIPTTKQLFILNRWRRVYCDIFSNSGMCYVIVDGQEVTIDDCNMGI